MVNSLVKPRMQQIYRLFIVALAYFVTGWLGLLLPYVSSNITLLWLPAGIAIAALLRWDKRLWPAIFLAALAVNLSMGSSLALAFSIAVGDTFACVFSVWLLNAVKFDSRLIKLNDMFLLVVLAPAAMLISATVGIASLFYYGVLDTSQLKLAWLVWWLGDTVGILLVLPVLLTVSKDGLRHLWKSRMPYLVACLAVFFVEIAIFQFIPRNTGQFALLALLVLPLVISIATRYGMTAGSLAVLGLSIIAVLMTVNMQGPFNQANIQQGILSLWVFMSTLAIVVLMIALLQNERLETERALRSSEARFRAVVDGALDAVVTIDESGCLVEFNPAAERIFGYTRQQVIGRPLSEVIIPPAMRNAHSKGHQHFLRRVNRRFLTSAWRWSPCAQMAVNSRLSSRLHH